MIKNKKKLMKKIIAAMSVVTFGAGLVNISEAAIGRIPSISSRTHGTMQDRNNDRHNRNNRNDRRNDNQVTAPREEANENVNVNNNDAQPQETTVTNKNENNNSGIGSRRNDISSRRRETPAKIVRDIDATHDATYDEDDRYKAQRESYFEDDGNGRIVDEQREVVEERRQVSATESDRERGRETIINRYEGENDRRGNRGNRGSRDNGGITVVVNNNIPIENNVNVDVKAENKNENKNDVKSENNTKVTSTNNNKNDNDNTNKTEDNIGSGSISGNSKPTSSQNPDCHTGKVDSEISKLPLNSEVYFKDVTVLRSAPSEANRENWLAGYAGKATLVSLVEVDGVNWAAVRTIDGKLVYVREDELSATNPLVTPTGDRNNKNVDISNMMGVKNTVKLYNFATEQSDCRGPYDDETGLEVLERKINGGEEWIKVKTCSNDIGWCKVEYLCPLQEKLHIIINPSTGSYELNLNVGSTPRSMIPSDLIVASDGNVKCSIGAAYLKNSINAHVFYDKNGIAHGTRGAEAFDLSELKNTEITGTAGFTPDGWVNFRLADGRTITINMSDLNPI